jgi:iron(III) transport system substrate-binding protein
MGAAAMMLYRIWSRGAGALTLAWSVTCATAQPGELPAIYSYQGADRAEHLVAKARVEGTLTLYTSMATSESGPLTQAFEKRYGVKVQLWRALSENVLQRTLTEARAGRRSMDVVETNAPEVEALGREQVVAPFDSPYVAELPAWAIPPHRRWFGDRANLWVSAYNTAKIKREELPANARRLRRSPLEGSPGVGGERQRLVLRCRQLHGRNAGARILP